MLEQQRAQRVPARQEFSEITEAKRGLHPETKYREIERELSVLAKQFFPDEFKKFKAPSVAKIYKSFLSSVYYFREQEFATNTEDADKKAVEKTNVLIAAAIIRYVDNFIDEALWPAIHEYDPKILEPHFKAFLEAALAFAQHYDPTMPRDIIRLPVLEMNLELYPTQENFEKNIWNLITYKSFDLAYIDGLFRGGQKIKVHSGNNFYMGKALIDFARDFADGAEHDVDFNVKLYILKNNLDPTKLIQDISEFLSKVYNYPGDGDDYSSFSMSNAEWNVIKTCNTVIEALKCTKKTNADNEVPR